MDNTIVVLLYSLSLFAAGVESRLRGFKSLDVVHMKSSETNIMDKISKLKPDVIIVDAQEGALVVDADFLEILNKSCSSKLITLDLSSDEIVIYERNTKQVETGADLVEAIKPELL